MWACVMIKIQFFDRKDKDKMTVIIFVYIKKVDIKCHFKLFLHITNVRYMCIYKGVQKVFKPSI